MQLLVLVGTHRRVAGRLLALLDEVHQLRDGDAMVLGLERLLESLVGPGPEGSELDEFLIALHGIISSVFILFARRLGRRGVSVDTDCGESMLTPAPYRIPTVPTLTRIMPHQVHVRGSGMASDRLAAISPLIARTIHQTAVRSRRMIPRPKASTRIPETTQYNSPIPALRT